MSLGLLYYTGYSGQTKLILTKEQCSNYYQLQKVPNMRCLRRTPPVFTSTRCTKEWTLNILLVGMQAIKHCTVRLLSTCIIYYSGKFEGICLPVFNSFLEPVRSFANSTDIPITSIQKVVLVGGTCKIPKLQQLLRDTFPNSEVLFTIPPDQVTAMGAAMQGQYASDVAFDAAPSTSILCTPESIIVKVCPAAVLYLSDSLYLYTAVF